MTITAQQHLNGVDTATLFATIDAVRQQPEAAKFQFRTSSEWVSGIHSRGRFPGFFGAGQEHVHAGDTVIDADHPAVLVGTDQGPTPAELLLNALASCLMAGLGNIASARGVELHGVRCKVEGDIDLRGILGIDPTVRNGFEDIRVTFAVDGDADAEKLESLVRQSQDRSAVFDVLTHGTNVTVQVAARLMMTGLMSEPTTARPPRVRADDVSRTVRGRTLVDHVSLTVEAGEMVALIGGSGAGKTSLLETLVGLHAPTSGSVLVDGVDVAQDRREVDVGLVPQDDIIHLDLPLRTTLRYAARLRLPGTVTDSRAGRGRRPRADRPGARRPG